MHDLLLVWGTKEHLEEDDPALFSDDIMDADTVWMVLWNLGFGDVYLDDLFCVVRVLKRALVLGFAIVFVDWLCHHCADWLLYGYETL